ncbi:MAG: inosine/xanthosine triphosphatase [Chloroflexota bacterium]
MAESAIPAAQVVVVASTNPVKVQAVRRGFERMFPGATFEFHTLSVPSGVRDQPASDREALQGARNRAAGAAAQSPAAAYWVGVEGGVEEQDGEMAAFAWIVIQADGLCGKGRTGTFYLPWRVAGLVRQGVELGEADDIVFGRSNSKQENGAVGLLTGDVLNRAQLYEQAVILALMPFKNPELYSEAA